ncbi:hypothetical protein FQZ97_703740 [compost metagenome]
MPLLRAQARGADAGDEQQGGHGRERHEQLAGHAAHAFRQAFAQHAEHLRPGEPRQQRQRDARRGDPALQLADEQASFGFVGAAQPHQHRDQDHRQHAHDRHGQPGGHRHRELVGVHGVADAVAVRHRHLFDGAGGLAQQQEHGHPERALENALMVRVDVAEFSDECFQINAGIACTRAWPLPGPPARCASARSPATGPPC